MTPPRKRARISSPAEDEEMEDLTQGDRDSLEEIEFRLSQAGPSSSQPVPFHEDSFRTESESPPRPSLPLHLSQSVRGPPLFASASTLPRFAPPRPSSQSDNPFSTASNHLKRARGSSPGLRDSPGLSDDEGRRRTRSQSSQKSLRERLDSPVTLGPSGFTSASRLGPTVSGFTTAIHVPQNIPPSSSYRDNRSPSPDEPPQEPDFSAWFTSTTVPGAVGFASASFTTPAPAGPIGFSTASLKKIVVPSATALKEAEARMKQWDAEDEEDFGPSAPTTNAIADPEVIRRTSYSPRQALREMDNGIMPETPIPPGRRSSGPAEPTPSPTFQFGVSSDFKGKASTKPFKSPLISRPSLGAKPPSTLTSTPRSTTPRREDHSLTFTPARTLRSVFDDGPPVAGPSGTSFATPVRQAAFATPPRLGVTPRGTNGQGKAPRRFVTPFKNGMRPGEPGRTQLEERSRSDRAISSVKIITARSTSPARTPTRSFRQRVFDLTPPPIRKTLAESGLWPGTHDTHHLLSIGIDRAQLAEITPDTALYYVFYNSSGVGQTELDHAVALEELHALGCHLATKEWVDNHWRLILWKLAGMVCLDPEQEEDPSKRRWSWDEVMRQLRYRYEKELNGGQRPALRMIATQDSPSGTPMVLCVSQIVWSEAGVSSDDFAIASAPELEVTDGWYRLRATVDAPLARAIARGVIRVGCKIAVAGARLSTAKSEPCEVLDAYDTVQLTLSGNSSHLAPWHAKLGFVNHPCVSTLHSLTPDGGLVQLLDLVVTKIYPIAFIEFLQDENGNKRREGPRKEKEEMEVHEQWKKRRDAEEARLRQEFENKMLQYQTWAEKLELKTRGRFYPSEDDSPPDDVEDLFDDLDAGNDYHEVTSHLTIKQAGWLAVYIRDRSLKERETIGEEIERDLKTICPPREVRNFRVLFMKDARTERRPANRTVEITVWDVLSLSFDEGRQPGTFREGQRFLISNLLPSQHSAWMSTAGEDPHIYLSTRRDSRWRRL